MRMSVIITIKLIFLCMNPPISDVIVHAILMISDHLLEKWHRTPVKGDLQLMGLMKCSHHKMIDGHHMLETSSLKYGKTLTTGTTEI